MEKKKIFAIAGITLWSILVLAVFGWWLVVCCFMPTKFLSYTINVDKQRISTTDKLGNPVTDERYPFEINIYDNMYEFIINSIWDEKENAFRSICFQYVTGSSFSENEFKLNKWSLFNLYGSSYNLVKTEEFGAKEKVRNNNVLIWKDDVTQNRNKFYNFDVFKSASVYSYTALSQGTELAWKPNEKIKSEVNTDKFFFLFQVGSGDKTELFGVSPKGCNITLDKQGEFYLGENTQAGDFNVGLGDTAIYRNYNWISCNMNYIMNYVYYACCDLPSGTDAILPIEFGDYFNFKYNAGNNQYKDLTAGDSKYANISSAVKSSFNIKVKRIKGQASTAHESLIGWYKGVKNFGVTEENSYDYTSSSNIYEVKNKDFTFDNGVLTLCDSFKSAFADYVGKIRLRVVIDFTEYKFLGYEKISINSDDFFVALINGNEVNQKLNNYELEVVA